MPREQFSGFAANRQRGQDLVKGRVPLRTDVQGFVEVSVCRLGDIDGEWKSEEEVIQAFDMNGDDEVTSFSGLVT